MSRCFRDEEIAAIAALPASDARRAHIDDCPRCHALLAAYEEFFRAPGAEVERLEAADAALARAIDAEIGVASAARARDGFRLSEWWRPRRALAWSAAAAVVAIAGAWIVFAPRAGRETTWRGERDPSAAAFEVRATPARDGTTIALEWPAVPGATAYRVHLTRDDLSDLGMLEAGPETRYDLWLDAPPIAGTDVRTLLAQVEARAGEQTLARSRPVPLVAR
jgi:hypothetical protein